jgi:hypothetical protein
MFLVAIAALTVVVWQGGLAIRDCSRGSYGDAVDIYASRFTELRRVLPGVGLVGYLGDRKPEDLESDVAFMLAQYTLAPLVVEKSTTREWVIGNFSDAPPTAQDLAGLNLEPVRDFGAGVVLYRWMP